MAAVIGYAPVIRKEGHGITSGYQVGVLVHEL